MVVVPVGQDGKVFAPLNAPAVIVLVIAEFQNIQVRDVHDPKAPNNNNNDNDNF